MKCGVSENLMEVLLTMPFFIGCGLIAIISVIFLIINRKKSGTTKAVVGIIGIIAAVIFVVLLVLAYQFGSNHPAALPVNS